MTLLLWGVWALALWWLAGVRAPAIAWTAALALPLVACTLTGEAAAPLHLALWTAFLLVALPLNLPPLRRRLISAPVLRLFRKLMPPMSQTEQEALHAGTVWWDAELFSGRPDWAMLFATPAPALSAEEQAFLDGPVEELCRRLDDWKINEEWHDLPPDVWRFL